MSAAGYTLQIVLIRLPDCVFLKGSIVPYVNIRLAKFKTYKLTLAAMPSVSSVLYCWKRLRAGRLGRNELRYTDIGGST